MGSAADLKIKVTTDTSSAVGGLTKVLFSFNQLTAAASTVSNAVSKVSDAVKDCVNAYDIQQQAEIKLQAALKATGNQIGLNLGEMKKMASGFQSVTTYGDETVLAMQSLMVSSRAIGKEILPEVTQAALDMATAMGTDAVSAAKKMSDVMANPDQATRKLRESNVYLTKAVQDQIKTLLDEGRTLDAQKLILKEIEGAYGGISNAVAQTDIGKITQTANAWGDVKENIGQLILMYSSGAIDFISKATQDLAAKIAKFTEEKTNSAKIAKGAYTDVSTDALRAEADAITADVSKQMADLRKLKYETQQNSPELYDANQGRYDQIQEMINEKLEKRRELLDEIDRRNREAAEATMPTVGSDDGLSSGSADSVTAEVKTVGDYIRENMSLSKTAQLLYLDMQIEEANLYAQQVKEGTSEYDQIQEIISALKEEKKALEEVNEESSKLSFQEGANAAMGLVSALASYHTTLANNAKAELQEMKSAWNDYFSDLQAKNEKDRDILQRQFESGILSAEQYQEAVTSMYEEETEAKEKEREAEEELQEKADKEAEKAFRANQLNSFASAMISGSEAIMRTWASYPFWVAAPLTAVLATTTAVQGAAIMSQKYTNAATGAIVDKPTHIYAGEGEGPEAVIPLSRQRLEQYGLVEKETEHKSGVIYLTINAGGTDTVEAVFKGIERAQRQGLLPKWRYA